MPDKPKSIDEVMQEAWDQTMGEATDTLPEESHFLGDVLASDDDATANKEVKSEETPPQEDAGTQLESESSGEEQPKEEGDTQQKAESVDAPQHWSEADRTMFGTLTKEAQDFLLRRHRDMEADYTRKTQENSTAIKLGKAALEVIDPEIQSSLQMAGVPQDQFLKNLVGYHKLSMQDPAGFVRAVVQSLGLDPAKVFAASPPAGEGQQQTQAAPDPLSTRLAAIEGRLNRDEQARLQEVRQTASTEIQNFSQEKDAQGNLVRPHFDKVKEIMGRLMIADESLDLQQAYEVAVYRDPELRKTINLGGAQPSQQTVQVDMDKVRRGEEAARAAKSNRRGNGNGATPAKTADRSKPMSLSEAMNAAADEVGLK